VLQASATVRCRYNEFRFGIVIVAYEVPVAQQSYAESLTPRSDEH